MSYNTELQENNADLQEILDAVNALPEAGAELPELTNPGTAEDLEEGKELIDGDGNVVTGTINVAHGGVTKEATVGYIPMGEQSQIKMSARVTEKTIIDPSVGDVIYLTAPCSEFGDAEEADVMNGKTFTSKAGLQKVGTCVPLDTSDATAKAEQMANGVTAYVNGEKVTGTAYNVFGSYPKTVSPKYTTTAGGAVKLIQMAHTIADPTFFGTTGATDIILQTETSEFGDAEASDVAKGKTFTSEAGLKVVGTKEEAAPANLTDANISENGTYTPPEGYDGFSQVVVNVPAPAPNLQAKTVTPSTQEQVIIADEGYDGLSSVTVEAVEGGGDSSTDLLYGYVQNESTQYIEICGIVCLPGETTKVFWNGMLMPFIIFSDAYVTNVGYSVTYEDEGETIEEGFTASAIERPGGWTYGFIEPWAGETMRFYVETES